MTEAFTQWVSPGVEIKDNYGSVLDVGVTRGHVSKQVKIHLFGFGPKGGKRYPYEFDLAQSRALRDKLDKAISKGESLVS